MTKTNTNNDAARDAGQTILGKGARMHIRGKEMPKSFTRRVRTECVLTAKIGPDAYLEERLQPGATVRRFQTADGADVVEISNE